MAFNKLGYWQKYPHLCCLEGTTLKRKATTDQDKVPVVNCLCCEHKSNCEFYKDGTINYRNFYIHVAGKHPYQLLPEDVRKLLSKEPVPITEVVDDKAKDPFQSTTKAVMKKLSIAPRNLTQLITKSAVSLIADEFLPFNMITKAAFQALVRNIIDAVTERKNKVNFHSNRQLRRYLKAYVHKAVDENLKEFRKDVEVSSKFTHKKISNFSTDGTSNGSHFMATTAQKILLKKDSHNMREYHLGCDVDENRQEHVGTFFFFAETVQEILDVDIIEYEEGEDGWKILPTKEIRGKQEVDLDRVQKIKDHVTVVTVDDGSGTCAQVLRDLGIDVILCCAHKLHNFCKKAFSQWTYQGVRQDSFAEKVTAAVYEVLNTVRGSGINLKELKRVQKEVLNWIRTKLPLRSPMVKFGWFPRGLWRFLEILESLERMDVDNLYFRTPDLKQQFLDALSEAKGYEIEIRCLLAFFDRVLYWIKQTEYGKQVTISSVLFMGDDLQLYLDHMISDLGNKDIPRNRKEVLIAALRHYKVLLDAYMNDDHQHVKWTDNMVYKLAELLDPRFAVNQRTRGAYFKNTFDDFYDHRLRKMVVPDPPVEGNEINDADADADADFFTFEQRGNVEDQMSKQAIHKKLFNAEVTKYATQIYNEYYKGKTEDEIMIFRNEFDVIQFWFDNRGNYPMLAEIAVKILEIAAQSSCPERVFSALTYLLLNNRRHLHPDLVGKMVINYMIKHRKDQGKLRPYPPQGKEWPADARGIARLPDLAVELLHDEDELPEDEFAEIAGEIVPTIVIDGDRVPIGEDEYDSEAEEDYEIEGAIYPSDRPPPPVRRNGIRHDYAAMNSGK